MKKVILILNFFILNAYADQSMCLSTNITDNLEEIEKLNCDLIDKMNSCVVKEIIDVDAAKRLKDSLNLLHEAHLKQSPIEFRKKYNASTDISQNFTAQAIPAFWRYARYSVEGRPYTETPFNSSEYDKIRRDSKIEVESALDKFLEISKSENQFNKLANKIVNDSIQFQEQFQCTSGTSVFTKSIHHTLDKEKMDSLGITDPCFETEQAAKNFVNSNQVAIDDFYLSKYSGDSALERNFSCGGIYHYKNWKKTVQNIKSCTGNFQHLFADNEWKLPSMNQMMNDERFSEFKKCVDDMKAQGFELNNISINASSSQLNNTSIAKERFCRKGFKELSEARAFEAQRMLSDELGLPSANSINFMGTNRNGSSGECPYELINGKEVLKREYRIGGNKRAELDDAKYVKVNVSFKPKFQNGPDRVQNCFMITKTCEQLRFKCMEWSDNQFQPGWPKR